MLTWKVVLGAVWGQGVWVTAALINIYAFFVLQHAGSGCLQGPEWVSLFDPDMSPLHCSFEWAWEWVWKPRCLGHMLL